ncbi:MAG TPA: efflux RND transporter periplasmic adaptor subunit [Thermoanaerobaculia bacterium]|nr:efflux RND transporter periplasmic adaptor subunit [Thermoanaerobaculia bacterium]
MKKRMFIMLASMTAFVAIIGSVKFLQVRSAMAQQGSFQPPPEAVTTTIASEEQWDATLSAIGSVTAVNGVVVSADLPGIVEQIAFDSGRSVRKGDVLVRLGTTQERAQLQAAQAHRNLARVDLERKKGLLSEEVISRAVWDQAVAELEQAEARIGEIRASIERKTIRAPFSGVLGIRQINLGQYLAGGDPIVSLQAFQPVYVNFSVPQQQLSRLTIGSDLHVTSDSFDGAEVGRLTSFDSAIDESTRSVRVQAIFDNRSGKLRPGMFVEAKRAEGVSTPVVLVPVSSISYAPFGDSVFIVEEVKGPDGKGYRGVRQQFVKLGGTRGDQVAILSGVKSGEEIVTSGVFKLRPGAAVQINNSIQPGNDPSPSPEDS